MISSEFQEIILAHVRPRLGEGTDNYFDNVVGHVLMVERVFEVLADLVHLSKSDRRNGQVAALVHEIGKKEEKMAAQAGVDRVTAEAATQISIAQEFGPEIAFITRGETVAAMAEYYQGHLSGEEDWLTRLLFFADECVSNTEFKPWWERIAAWKDEALHTEPHPEYGMVTQALIELDLSARVQQEILERAGLHQDTDLMGLINGRLFEHPNKIA